MQLHESDVIIATTAGQMPAFWCRPEKPARLPTVLLLMESFGLNAHIRKVAVRIAREGYGVLAPDLYYRKGPYNTFGYDQVDAAMSMMWRLDFGQPMEDDLGAAIAYLQSRPEIKPDRIGVTGFCLGGGLTFLTACRFSAQIAAAAPFYGMVLDEWIEAVKDITVPMLLSFGGIDPFIGRDRIRQIEARFQALNKDYTVKIYPDANHGFFCDERAEYHPAAAAEAWCQLMRFFRTHLAASPASGAEPLADPNGLDQPLFFQCP